MAKDDLASGTGPGGRGSLAAAQPGEPRPRHRYVSLLGLKPKDPVALARSVRRGFPYATLERFQGNTSLTTREVADAILVTLRTLHRRKEQGRLEPDESDRLLRFSRVFGTALELFEGDVASARTWLFSPLEALGGECPIELAKTDVGAREVEALVGRLEHGVPG